MTDNLELILLTIMYLLHPLLPQIPKFLLRRPNLRRMTPLPVLSMKKAPVTRAVLPKRHRTLLSLQR